MVKHSKDFFRDTLAKIELNIVLKSNTRGIGFGQSPICLWNYKEFVRPHSLT